QEKDDNVNSTNNVNTASNDTTDSTNNVNAASSTVNAFSTNEVNDAYENISIEYPDDPNMPELEDIRTFDFSVHDEDDAVEADMNNLDTSF
ncbi:hypothetical protein Tco_0993202, partial [Tanacetum coccineum]